MSVDTVNVRSRFSAKNLAFPEHSYTPVINNSSPTKKYFLPFFFSDLLFFGDGERDSSLNISVANISCFSPVFGGEIFCWNIKLISREFRVTPFAKEFFKSSEMFIQASEVKFHFHCSSRKFHGIDL